MHRDQRLRTSLFALRVSVFLVMLMWTIDKLMRAEHAAAVFAAFYGLGGLGAGNLLFFAAWPMLGAALALFLLRDEDRLWTV